MNDLLIDLKDITKTYHMGKVDVPALKGVTLGIQQRGNGSYYRSFGFGKVDPDEYYRVSG